MYCDFFCCFYVYNDFCILNWDFDVFCFLNGEKKEKNLIVKEVVENLCFGVVGGGGEYNRV